MSRNPASAGARVHSPPPSAMSARGAASMRSARGPGARGSPSAEYNSPTGPETDRAGRAAPPPSARLQPDGDLDASQRVMVAVRVRPHNKADAGVSDVVVRRSPESDESIECHQATGRPKQFAYDYVFDQHNTQGDVYDQIGSPFIEDAFSGYNCCIFAYGQTGSGKTYSMFGNPEGLEQKESRDAEDVRSEDGLLPRVVTQILEKAQELQLENSALTCKIQVSFLEIYNEKVRDLLNPPKGISQDQVQAGKVDLPELKLTEDRRSRKWVAKDLKTVSIMSLRAVMELIADGSRFRQRAGTSMNEVSSRSHSVFCIYLKQMYDPPSAVNRDKECKVTIVDLAGSERQSKTQIADAKHLKEAEQINLSLLTLGRCLNAFSSGGGSRVHVPVRDSALTRLLADIFGGNSKTLMFATVSPSSTNLSESVSTLQYASNAKKIKHNAKINTMAKQLEIKELKEQVEQLGKTLLAEIEKSKQQREHDKKRIDSLEKEKGSMQKQMEEAAEKARQLEMKCRQLQEENEKLGAVKLGKIPGLALGKIAPGSGSGVGGPGDPFASARSAGGGTPRDGRPRKAKVKVGAEQSAAAAAAPGQPAVDLPQQSTRVKLGEGDESSDEEDDVVRDEKLRVVHAELTAKLLQMNPALATLSSQPPTARSGWTMATSRGMDPSLYNDPMDSARFDPYNAKSSRDGRAPVRAAEVRSLIGHSAAVYSCAFSADGTRCVSASRDRSLKVWDVSSGDDLVTLRGHHGFALNCDFSPCGEMVVSASDDKTLRLWDSQSGKKLKTFRGHGDKVYCAQFSPSGKEVASASCDKTVKVWSVETAKKLITLRGHTSAVFCACFSRDGQRIVSASDDKTLRVWKWQAQQELQLLQGHTGTVWSCRFHPDGKHVVSSSMDGTVKLWNVAQPAAILTFRGHTAPVHHAVFAKDGQLVVSASRDRTLKVWSTEDGQCVQTFVGHTNTVYHCSVHNSAVLSCSSDDVLKVWKISN